MTMVVNTLFIKTDKFEHVTNINCILFVLIKNILIFTTTQQHNKYIVVLASVLPHSSQPQP